jgi:DNA-binding winged helix-turn-helix (wHTH) protein/tetratricopeptide (TPR) repeat protein
VSGAKEADGLDRERSQIYSFDGFELDVGALRLTGEDGAIVAEPRALEVLAHLLERRGHLVTRDELAEAIWGDAVPSDAAIARAIHGARRLLGDDARRQRYVVTVHGRGYRWASNVAVASGTAPSHGTGKATGPARHAVGWSSAVGIATVTAVLGLWLARSPPVKQPPAADRLIRVAVVPPDLGADGRLFGIALCEQIGAALDRVPGLLARDCGLGISASRNASSLVEIHRRSAADAVLSLDADPQVRTLRPELSVLDETTARPATITRTPLPAAGVPQESARDPRRLSSIADALAGEVVERLLGRPVQRPAGARGLESAEPDAYRLFLRGKTAAAHAGCGDAAPIDLLVRAVDRDPGLRAAWIALARSHLHQASECGFHPRHYGSALEALARARELGGPDPEATALTARALVELGRPVEAFAALEEAETELADPILEVAAAQALVYVGALDGARRHLERALIADPDSLRVGPDLILPWFETHHPATLLELSSPLPGMAAPATWHLHRGLAWLRLGDPEAARKVLHLAFQTDPGEQPARLAEALEAFTEGELEATRNIAASLWRSRRATGSGDPAVDHRLAQLSAVLGDHDEAIERWAQAVEDGFFCARCVSEDPIWKALRRGADDRIERRIAQLLERATLESDAFLARWPVRAEPSGEDARNGPGAAEP